MEHQIRLPPAAASPHAVRYRMSVAYDGTQYAGWQVQPAHMTVQQRMEEVLASLTGETVKIHGSGRTDQGVHARGQVAHFDLHKTWPSAVLQKGLNALLPADVRVMRLSRAAQDFHARRHAVRKEYRYFIWNSEILDPCSRLYATHVRRRLDIAAMRAAAEVLVGQHDFAAFTANPNRVVESTVRRVDYIRIRKTGASIVVAVASEGFLYKMVRSICGLLIRVGDGAVSLDEVGEILASRVRTARVPTAPPEGLFLWRVWY